MSIAETLKETHLYKGIREEMMKRLFLKGIEGRKRSVVSDCWLELYKSRRQAILRQQSLVTFAKSEMLQDDEGVQYVLGKLPAKFKPRSFLFAEVKNECFYAPRSSILDSRIEELSLQTDDATALVLLVLFDIFIENRSIVF